MKRMRFLGTNLSSFYEPIMSFFFQPNSIANTTSRRRAICRVVKKPLREQDRTSKRSQPHWRWISFFCQFYLFFLHKRVIRLQIRLGYYSHLAMWCAHTDKNCKYFYYCLFWWQVDRENRIKYFRCCGERVVESGLCTDTEISTVVLAFNRISRSVPAN